MVARALARYLSAHGLVDLREHQSGGDCFLEATPPAPDDAVIVKSVPGSAPLGSVHLGYDEPGVTLTVRGTDMVTTMERAQALYERLQGLHDVTLDPTGDAVRLHRCASPNSGPYNLGLDEKGRCRFLLNFALHVRAVTVNRA